MYKSETEVNKDNKLSIPDIFHVSTTSPRLLFLTHHALFVFKIIQMMLQKFLHCLAFVLVGLRPGGL